MTQVQQQNGEGYNGRYTCEQMITALVAANGRVYVAAETLGCAPCTVYRYMDNHPTVRKAKEAAEGMRLDVAEGKLDDKVTEGDLGAITFLLKTKGKKRGYTTVQEIATPPDRELVVEHRQQLSDEQIQRIADSITRAGSVDAIGLSFLDDES